MAERHDPMTEKEIATNPHIVEAAKNAFRRGLDREQVRRVVWSDAPAAFNQVLEKCEREVKGENEGQSRRALEKNHERQAR